LTKKGKNRSSGKRGPNKITDAQGLAKDGREMEKNGKNKKIKIKVLQRLSGGRERGGGGYPPSVQRV